MKQICAQEKRSLLVLGCSATKVQTDSFVPAISLYDGPMFRVLRTYLREYKWPLSLSVAVLSAKYGLVGGLSTITNYNQRMTPSRALKLCSKVTATLSNLAPTHSKVDLLMGRDYLRSIDFSVLHQAKDKFRFADGPIGLKLNQLHDLLRSFPTKPRTLPKDLPRPSRPLYFLPDWDDFLDVEYDFISDTLSDPDRSSRHEDHSIAIMRPNRLCDGVLVSLAQHLGTKGLLKRVPVVDDDSLAPVSVRHHFKLESDQWAFGDCGAFSYSSECEPSISVERAVSVYGLYEFDLGASVDHIPLEEVYTDKGKVRLTQSERKRRVRLTRDNAARFMELHKAHDAKFIPVGVIQGIQPIDYSKQIHDYLDMGYRHLAFGGLVPRSDDEILEIVQLADQQSSGLKVRPWLHLLGIFRPALQGQFKQLGVNSFDSATYFRKAWLRSGQNYLAKDGKWYAAIRVPPTSDPRTLKRLKMSGVSEKKIQILEEKALSSLHDFDRGRKSLKACLNAVIAYDSLLERGEGIDSELRSAYRRTLEARPWDNCKCPMCRKLKIDVLIFRGLNRNKRRGAHNTLQLYNTIGQNKPATKVTNAP